VLIHTISQLRYEIIELHQLPNPIDTFIEVDKALKMHCYHTDKDMERFIFAELGVDLMMLLLTAMVILLFIKIII